MLYSAPPKQAGVCKALAGSGVHCSGCIQGKRMRDCQAHLHMEATYGRGAPQAEEERARSAHLVVGHNVGPLPAHVAHVLQQRVALLPLAYQNRAGISLCQARVSTITRQNSTVSERMQATLRQENALCGTMDSARHVQLTAARFRSARPCSQC